MGFRYKTTCKACNHSFELVKGGGWTWYQKVCDSCGLCMKVPRQGPQDFIDGQQMSYLDMVKHLENHDEWSRRGGQFDDEEKAILSEMTKICQCGGNLVPEWDSTLKYRCPECKSSDLSLSSEILFD